MKKQILFILSLALCSGAFATVHTVSNAGFTFTPATLTIMEGDTIDFTISNSHNAVEVDSATWASNGSTAKPGGFSAPFGGGMVVLSTAGSYFYVCTPHAGQGMKGQITVEAAAVTAIVSLQTSEISIYPNPASERLTVKLPVDQVFESVEIANLKGQVILSQAVENQLFDLAIPPFAKGVYVLRLRNAEGVLSKKIILE